MADEKFDGWQFARDFVRDVDLIRYQGEWFKWQRTHWQDEHPDLMQQTIAQWLIGKGFTPNSTRVGAIEYYAITLRAQRLGGLPAWVGTPVAEHVLSCANGLVDLETGEVHPHTPAYINLNAVDYAFDPEAPEPAEWLAFLDSVWGDDPEWGCEF